MTGTVNLPDLAPELLLFLDYDDLKTRAGKV
jgi:hypothetical protein